MLTLLHDLYISEEDVSSAMHNIPDKLSRTPDGIPSYFWKRASAPFFHRLSFFFLISVFHKELYLFNGKLLLLYLCLRRALVIYLAVAGLYLWLVFYVEFLKVLLSVNYYATSKPSIYFL